MSMRVKLDQAVKMFFSNSSLEMVYIEAIANALDADADKITITISAKALNHPETLHVEISDNGEGFTDERYKKFSILFDVDESTHKGLGRLVYLCYFNEIEVLSFYNKNKYRVFKFDENFDETNSYEKIVSESESSTTFKMQGYTLHRIAKSEYIHASYLKKRILEEFYSRLFHLKNDGHNFQIKIITEIDSKRTEEILNNSDIPEFKIVEINNTINLTDTFTLYYSIIQVNTTQSFISAVTVDNRTFKIDLIAEENIPVGYEMVFLLFSDYFLGKVDMQRQDLTISKSELRDIEAFFRKEVASIIEKEIPKIKERNLDTNKKLSKTYPHLIGYFEKENIGYIKRDDIIQKAQNEFFKNQKELLDASSLTDEQFIKALDMSSRSLTEYILFRQLTIEKLRKTTGNNSEFELHKLFVPTRKEGKFEKSNFINDIYRNNSWLLDDKYMTYETVLSDRELSDVLKFVTENEVKRDDDRIDIALIFSNNPKNSKPFDVVIVELKKKGISLEENMKVITQLEKRARKLMQYYNNQIQRIWFYGIIEFNEEVELQLSGEYTELYSSGKMYYKETTVAISLEPKKVLPIGVFIWDINAVIEDAHLRNSAFLNLIKSNFNVDGN
ncbi:MAG: ATP-binding protein [bacterium]